ncbi:MAG: DUF4388 domain-containing protein [Deltaproteobacteria bacterium]
MGDGARFRPVLWGELSGMPLPDLLSALAHSRRTGLLLVRCREGSERALGVVRGLVTFSASSEPSERDLRDVAYGLVRLHHGDFVFLSAAEGVLPEGGGASAQEVLLDGLRRLDEETRPAPTGLAAG